MVGSDDEMVKAVDKLIKPDIIMNPASENIRYRHVEKDGDHYYILFNENENAVTTKLRLSIPGNYSWLSPYTAEVNDISSDNTVSLKPHELKVLWLSGKN